MAKRRVDWAEHKRVLAAGMKAVRKAAPSPNEVAALAGRADAMQLARWGVPWPPPAGWAQQLRELWQAQQGRTDAPSPPAQTSQRSNGSLMARMVEALGGKPGDDPLFLARGRMAEVAEGDRLIERHLERIADLERQLEEARTGPDAAPVANVAPSRTAAQIRRGGIMAERDAAVGWLLGLAERGQALTVQEVAAGLRSGAHHGRGAEQRSAG